jgi:hypothetical protein
VFVCVCIRLSLCRHLSLSLSLQTSLSLFFSLFLSLSLTSICEHNHIRSCCKQCDGSSICEHNRQRSSFHSLTHSLSFFLSHALCIDLSLSLSLSVYISLSLCTYHSTSAQLLREQRTEARQAQELPACRAWARIHHTAAMSWWAQWSSPATGCSLLYSLRASSALKT